MPTSRLQEMRTLMQKHFPAYCLFAGMKARMGGKVDLITLVHVRMAARASLLYVTGNHQELPEAIMMHALRQRERARTN